MGSEPTLPVISIPLPRHAIQALPSRLTERAEAPSQAMAEMQVSDARSSEAVTPDAPQQSVTFEPADVSTLLSLALLQGLSTLTTSSFPMPASLLYSAHVLPNRPAYIPEGQRDEVVIAKSSWKKLAKWMKEASKDGLLKIKEAKDGGVTVTRYA
jgi:translation initiation factor 2D